MEENSVPALRSDEVSARNILKGFSNAEELTTPTIKAISMEAFNTKYGTGYEVFTAKQILEFTKGIEKSISEDISKSEDLRSLQKEEITSLEKVYVIKGESPVILFVRPISKIKIEDAVKNDE